MSVRLTLLTPLTIALVVAPVVAEVMTSEFFSGPITEGWQLLGQQGDGTTWVADGVFYQDFPNNCPPEPICDLQAFTRSIQAFNGRPHWFYEYRCSATGDHTEIPAAAPTVLSAFNAFGNLYHATLASDQVKLSTWSGQPLFYDLGPGPHTIRLELFNDPPPATFHWYVDSVLVLEGLADSPFPDFDARITWQGETWQQPTLNAWYYIRAGDPAAQASSDFDSDAQVDDFDFFYFSECVDRSAAGEPAFPSCAWADMDADNDVDCADALDFQAAWTGTGDPPSPPNCVNGYPIPTVSEWGVIVMTLLMLTAGAIVLRRRAASPGV